MSVPHIVELATRIATNTTKVSNYLTENNIPQPSFDPETPLYGCVPKDAPEIEALRQSVLSDTAELRDLLLGPREYLLSFVNNSLLPQQAITRFGLAQKLPVGGETTFAEMAASSGLTENHVRKLVRFAVSQRIFSEPRPGVIVHSAASRLLAEDTGVHDFVATSSNELWPAASQTCNAMVQFPGSEEPTETVSRELSFIPYIIAISPGFDYLSRLKGGVEVRVMLTSIPCRVSPWPTIPTSPCTSFFRSTLSAQGGLRT